MMPLALAACFTACQGDEFEQAEQSFKSLVNGTGLTVSPKLLGSVVTRAVGDEVPGVDDLNENTLNTLDVFVAEKGGTSIVKQWHLNIADATKKTVNENVRYLLEEHWVDAGLDEAKKYTVYVAVNNEATTSDITTVAGLQAAHVTDNGIFTHQDAEHYRPTVGNNWGTDSYAENKQFVMSGVLSEWQYNASAADKEQVFPVDLERAAAKIIVDFEFTEDFMNSWKYEIEYETVDGVETTTPKRDDNGRLVFKKDAGGNFIEKTKEVTMLEVGSPAWRYGNFVRQGDVFNPTATGIASTLEVTPHTFGWMIRDELSYGAAENRYPFQILTYSYPYIWDQNDAINKAPFIIFSVGYIIDNVQPSKRGYDYYRVPIVDELTTNELKRNSIYKVKVKIDSFGSLGLNEATDLHPEYEVLPWNEEAADNSNLVGKNLDYLMVSPADFTLRGNGQQTVSLNFFKPVGKSLVISEAKIYYENASGTEVVRGVDNQYNNSRSKEEGVNNTNETEVKYGNTTIDYTTARGTYNFQTGTGGFIINTTENEQRGSFDVSSYSLYNHAIKYIEFKVTLEGTSLSRTIRLKHFPLDNIQNAAGRWSSRTTANWWDPSGLSGTWWNTTNPQGYGIGYDNLFRARYYYNNSNMRGAQNTSASNNHNWLNQTSLTNNRKYIIQIASTSDEYILGRPALNNNNQSQDHVVSPAFMIASQLGATTSQSPSGANAISDMARRAANHCGTYKEVDTDGTVWTGWRLPTREEVGIILQYQNAGYDTMSPVMTGSYYWTLEGAAVATGVTNSNVTPETWATNWAVRYSNSSYDYPGYYGDGVNRDSRGTYIRCIRDLSEQEVKKLNGE